MSVSAGDVSPQNRAFGVGGVISRSVSTFFINILPIVAFGYPVQLIFTLATTQAAEAFPEVEVLSELVISVIATGIVAALITPLIFDHHLGRPRRYGEYMRVMLAVLPILIVVSGLILLMAVIGMIMLIIPGLIVLTIFHVATPALVIERCGLSALTRSRDLTRGYRWPVFWMIFLMIVMTVLLALGVAFIAALAPIGLDEEHPVIAALIGAMSDGLFSVNAVIAYARLREIKEGLGMEEIASVFD
ncbi:MAG: hypothetical protein AAF401_00865 [Pseudomonadota bacterium]